MTVLEVFVSLCGLMLTASASPHDIFFARDPAACQRDNCLRAVVASSARPGPSSGLADCSSFMTKTLTPCPVTATAIAVVTTTLAPTTITSFVDTIVLETSITTALETSVTTSTVTEQTTVLFSTTITDPGLTTTVYLRDLGKRQATICPVLSSPSNVPRYASACSGTVRYSSACSCLGVTVTTTTIPATTASVTSTSFISETPSVTAEITRTSTSTITATQTSVLIQTSLTTTTETVSTTSTSRLPGATQTLQAVSNFRCKDMFTNGNITKLDSDNILTSFAFSPAVTFSIDHSGFWKLANGNFVAISTEGRGILYTDVTDAPIERRIVCTLSDPAGSSGALRCNQFGQPAADSFGLQGTSLRLRTSAGFQPADLQCSKA